MIKEINLKDNEEHYNEIKKKLLNNIYYDDCIWLLISSLETISSIINDETKVVSGHSEVSNETKVIGFTNMLKDVREKVSQTIEDGKSLEEIIASQPTSKYDEIYYDHTSRQPEDFVTFIYQSLIKK